MSHQTPSRTRAPAGSRLSSSTTRSATTTTSPFFKAEALNGTQSAPISIDNDDDDEQTSFSNVVAALSSKKRKRNDSAFIISDDEDDQRTTLRRIPLINGTPSSQTKAVSRTRKTTTTKSATKPRTPKTPKATPKKPKVASPEKRRRPFRNHAPQTYQSRYERAITQRMFLIDREKKTNKDEYGTYPEEVFDMAGTTGNVYQVTIGKVPKCTCPDARSNQCKHIIYVLVNVLKAPGHLQYQLAFLSSELEQIFDNAPASPQSSDGSKEDTSNAGKRKPIEGDCPICMMEFEKGEALLWCKAACGQNIHKACFEQWAKSKPGEVKCVYCRTPWKGDEETVKLIAKSGQKNAEGYVNVGSQLGLSGRRDTSTYYRSRSRSRYYDEIDYPGDEDEGNDHYEDEY